MTWPSDCMLRTAIWCRLAARFIHSDLASRRTILSLCCKMNGVTSIESTMPAINACSTPDGINALRSANDNITKANSPPCASVSAVRQEAPGVLPKSRAAPAMIPALPATSINTNSSTSHHCETSTLKSSVMPTVTKKSPRSKSRKGRMSSST